MPSPAAMNHEIVEVDGMDFLTFAITIRDGVAVEEVLRYLCTDALPDLQAVLSKSTPLYNLEVTAEFGPVELQEQALWEDLARTSAATFLELLKQYLDSISSCLPEPGTMFECHEPVSYGASAVRRCIQFLPEGPLTASEVYEPVMNYLRNICAWEMETIEDDLIKDLLYAFAIEETDLSSNSRWVDLICIRLINGQYHIGAQSSDFLSNIFGPKPSRQRAVSKVIMDKIVVEYGCNGIVAGDLKMILLATYGSNEQPRRQVAEWLAKTHAIQVNFDELSIDETRLAREADIRIGMVADACTNAYTGFHRLDRKKLEWVWNVEA